MRRFKKIIKPSKIATENESVEQNQNTEKAAREKAPQTVTNAPEEIQAPDIKEAD